MSLVDGALIFVQQCSTSAPFMMHWCNSSVLSFGKRWISNPRRTATHEAAIQQPNDRKASSEMSSGSTRTGQEDGDGVAGRPDRHRLADGRLAVTVSDPHGDVLGLIQDG